MSDVESVRAALAHPSGAVALRALQQHASKLQQRKILLSTELYPLYTHILARLLDNRTRPCLLCCEQQAVQLLTPPLPPQPATAISPAKPITEAGALFSLTFRTASFPPVFIAPVRTMLPVPLQRMLHTLPPQHLPPFFRARAVQSAPSGAAAAGGQAGVDYLELSLHDYYFSACAAFLLQPDIQVQGMMSSSSSSSAAPPSSVNQPPTPEAYTHAFLCLLSQYLDFFVPISGAHPSSLRLEDAGWNSGALLNMGWSMVQTWVEVLMGQFSYEAAQQPMQMREAGMQGGAQLSPFQSFPPSPFLPSPAPFALPVDEWTLPTNKVISAIMRIVYHLMEQQYTQPPRGSAAVQAVLATRASILQYQQEKYAQHADSMLVKLRVDWHFFGLLQHCFTRWAPEWNTNLGVAPVLLVSAAAAAASNSTALTSYASAPPRVVEDRLTKLVELWMDYLEPWKSLWNQEFNPLLWRWWIVSNLPFYTTLLRDFLHLLVRLDIGREQSPQRTAHLKTFIHLLKIFEGPVLECMEEVEGLLMRQSTSSSRDAQQNQQTQQETFVVRNALLNLAGQRPEHYVPIFPANAPITSTPASRSSGSAFTFTSPQRQMTSPARVAPMPPSDGSQARLLESQHLSLQLIRLYSIGYRNADAISAQREKALLDAPSVAPGSQAAQRSGMGMPSAPVHRMSLLAQEEQLGQHIELRLRTIFRLPEAPVAEDASSRRGGAAGSSSPRNNAESASAAGASGGTDSAPAPRSLRDLEPDHSAQDPMMRLSAEGRAQIRAGLRLCSKFDVPVLGGDEARPCGSDELAPVLAWSRAASRALNARWGLPKREGGFKINLRFLAQQQVFATLVGLLLVLLLVLWSRLR